jgi:hypothetical protein
MRMIVIASIDISEGNNRFHMCNVPVSDDEIITCIKLLKTKGTLIWQDFLLNYLKKFWVHLLVLKHIFTQSLASGIVPEKLKIA